MNFNKNKFKVHEIDVDLSNKNKFLKINKFIFKNKKSLGKGLHGIVIRHRGGGVKKKFRLINWKNRNKAYRVLNVHYDPYRTTFLSLVQYQDGSLSYILSHSKTKVNTFVNKTFNQIFDGNTTSLHYIPSKTLISNLELNPGKGATIARSAGSFCKIFKKTEKTAEIILPSKVKKNFSLECKATVGINSNFYHKFNKKYKAGNTRHLNKRPSVRGVAMNPIDHPHGGGEGKTSGGRPSTSPWGKLTKNVPTKKKR